MSEIVSSFDSEDNKKITLIDKMQKAYDWAFEANTSLYVLVISGLEEDLKRMFGDKYRDIMTIFEHVQQTKISKGYFTKEDILNIRIGNFMRSLREVVKAKEEDDARFEEQVQEYQM